MEYRDFIKTTKKNLILGSSTYLCISFLLLLLFLLWLFSSFSFSSFSFLTGELLDNRTLFADIIHGIENVIQAPKNTIKSISKQDSFNDSLNDSIQLLNFHQFETKHAQKFSVRHQNHKFTIFINLIVFFVYLFSLIIKSVKRKLIDYS